MTCDLKGGYKLKLRGNHQGSVALESIDTHIVKIAWHHTPEDLTFIAVRLSDFVYCNCFPPILNQQSY